MLTIQSHPPQSTVTTLTIDLAELPELSFVRRLAFALSLVLITSVEPRPLPNRTPLDRRARLARHERAARAQRERLAERELFTTIPRR
ncbi:hypothetical protein GCM10022286_19860 [Gryllotalpicola daejeonensis]|uniref:Uncharacterized protein n=1 Tax=Gryllotalpicola daejeonensis TaxID=993087 RepID=A0ABP7ZL92_9MICO